jgi:hypothetical protein
MVGCISDLISEKPHRNIIMALLVTNVTFIRCFWSEHILHRDRSFNHYAFLGKLLIFIGFSIDESKTIFFRNLRNRVKHRFFSLSFGVQYLISNPEMVLYVGDTRSVRTLAILPEHFTEA